MYNDIPSSLKFYNDKSKQLFRRFEHGGFVAVSASDYALPFQFIKDSGIDQVEAISIFNQDDELIDATLITHFPTLTQVQLTNGNGYIINKSSAFNSNYSMPIGNHYFGISIAGKLYYSDLFNVCGTKEELDSCMFKITYKSCKYVNGIYNSNSLDYADYIYLPNKFANPEYSKTFEKVKDTVGIETTIQGTYEKLYKFSLALPENLVDITQTIGFHDTIELSTPTGELLEILKYNSSEPTGSGLLRSVELSLTHQYYINSNNCDNIGLVDGVPVSVCLVADSVVTTIIAEEAEFWQQGYYCENPKTLNTDYAVFKPGETIFIFDDESRTTGKRYLVKYGVHSGWGKYEGLPEPVETQTIKDLCSGKYWLYVADPHFRWGKKPQIKNIERTPEGFAKITGVTFKNTFASGYSNNNINLSNLGNGIYGNTQISALTFSENGMTFGIVTYDSESHYFEATLNGESLGYSDPFIIN